MSFNKDVLKLDTDAVTEDLVLKLKHSVRDLKRSGAVVGISGGLDSSVVLALSVRAFGKDKVRGVMMPEEDSNPESEALARELSTAVGAAEPLLENLTPALDGFNCYQRRDEAIKRVFPEFTDEWKAKIVLPDLLESGSKLNIFKLTVIPPDGEQMSKRLNLRDYLQIVAASNFKQRSRMCMLYYHAELLNYAVIGTGNKNEHDQGFFVKYGDGGADVKPIAHFYKTQVFQLAAHLGVPQSICTRIPTTDTYSAECSQEEFFYRLPFQLMDLLWYAQENGVPAAEAAQVLELKEDQVQNAYDDFERKFRATQYLRAVPVEYR